MNSNICRTRNQKWLAYQNGQKRLVFIVIPQVRSGDKSRFVKNKKN